MGNALHIIFKRLIFNKELWQNDQQFHERVKDKWVINREKKMLKLLILNGVQIEIKVQI